MILVVTVTALGRSSPDYQVIYMYTMLDSSISKYTILNSRRHVSTYNQQWKEHSTSEDWRGAVQRARPVERLPIGWSALPVEETAHCPVVTQKEVHCSIEQNHRYGIVKESQYVDWVNAVRCTAHKDEDIRRHLTKKNTTITSL